MNRLQENGKENIVINLWYAVILSFYFYFSVTHESKAHLSLIE